MQIIDMSQPGLFIVNTTTNAFIVYAATDICQENEELMELCKAIVRLEREGRIVTSVQKLYPDGHRPRVSYRGTKEYKMAREGREDKIISATYVAYWDSGDISRVPCKVNRSTREVFDVDFAMSNINGAHCVLEHVQIGDTEIFLYDIDEIIQANAPWVQEKLDELKRKGNYWYSRTGNKLA